MPDVRSMTGAEAPDRRSAVRAAAWPPGDGEMAGRIRAHDWAATPLGPVENWPRSLRTALDMVLAMPGPAMILWGPAHVQLYNDAYVAIARRRHPALLGRPVAESWPDAYAEVIAPLLDAARAGRATQLADFPVGLREPDGGSEERLFDTAWSPIRDAPDDRHPEGAVAGVLQTLVEVTGRRRAEAALRESEARLRALATATSYAVYSMSSDWKEMRRLDGSGFLADTERPSVSWLDSYIALEDQPGVCKAIETAIRTKGLFDLEHRVRRADGSLGWTRSRAVPLLDGEGDIREWIGAASDVTERERAEAALRDSQARYQALFAASPVPFMVLAPNPPDFTILAANEAYFAATLTTPGTLIGRRLFDVFTDDPRRPGQLGSEALAISLDRVLAAQRTDAMERVRYDLVTPGGFEPHWWEAINAPMLDASGQVSAIIHQVTRVTELHLAEKMVGESQERQAFLLKLSDALRPLGSPGLIQTTAMRLVAEQFGASRALFCEVGPDQDEITLGGGHDADPVKFPSHMRLSDFGDDISTAFASGRTVAVEDAEAADVSDAQRQAYRATNVRAWLAVPLVKEGRLVALQGVHSPTPRVWDANDTQLLENVAERTWAAVERARAEAALRASEGRFRGFAENSADVLWIANATGTRLEYLSPAFEPVFGAPRDAVMAEPRLVRELVHPDDRARFDGAMPRTLAGETVIIHYRVVRPGGDVVHLRDTGFAIRDVPDAEHPEGVIRQVAGVVQDISDIVAAQEALEAEKERFRTLAEGIPQLVWRSGDDGQWTWSSPQWQAFTGQSQDGSQGWGWLDAVHPEDHEATMRAWQEAQPHGRLDVEYRVRRAADGAWRWHATRSVPVREPGPGGTDGRILEWLGTTTDIEDLKHLQGQQAVLVAELQHRTRNLLAVVRNVARRSIGPSPERDEYDARLAALGRVQGFLSRSLAYAVPLANLVDAELQAAGDGASDKVEVAGPAVELPGESVQAVALALHELATNAVKYGAIGQPGGRLSVTWHVESGDGGGDRRLVIEWQESRVAMPPGPPARRGYGSELITRALPYQLRAETELEFGPGGVRCRIALPASAFSRGTREATP